MSSYVSASEAVATFKFLCKHIQANLLGSVLGLWVGFTLERYYRHRREVIIANHLSFPSDSIVAQISRLYRPLSATVSEYEIDEDEDDDVQLLPTHSTYQNKSKVRLTDIWDEREDLFEIGEAEEEDRHEASTSRPQPQAPRIVISHS